SRVARTFPFASRNTARSVFSSDSSVSPHHGLARSGEDGTVTREPSSATPRSLPSSGRRSNVARSDPSGATSLSRRDAGATTQTSPPGVIPDAAVSAGASFLTGEAKTTKRAQRAGVVTRAPLSRTRLRPIRFLSHGVARGGAVGAGTGAPPT